jgi:hypothetical protein
MIGDHSFFQAPADIILASGSTELEALLPSVSLVRWTELSRLFPADVQTVCFECRLTEADEPPDLAFCLLPGPHATRLSNGLRGRFARNIAWLRFSDFLDEWHAPGATLVQEVPFVCVAFDGATDLSTLPSPCLSLCIDPDFFAKRLGFAPKEGPRSALHSLATRCFSRLTGSPLTRPPASQLERCLSDPEVHPKHVSFMLSRPATPMKLDVELSAAHLGPYLKRIGWPAPVDDLLDGVRKFVPQGGSVQVNLRIHPELAEPLELELLAGGVPANPGDRTSLLQQLVERGLCSRAKARALEHASAQPLSQDADGRRISRSWYIKVRFQGADAVDAKAYLGLTPRLSRVQVEDPAGAKLVGSNN